MRRIGRYLVLALVVLPAALFAAPSDPGGALGPSLSAPSLKGQLLIATEGMTDPRFDHAVILMVSHDHDGAFGIVINRPLGEKPLAEILEAFGRKDTGATGSVPVFLGGPVQLEASFTIHGSDYSRTHTRTVAAHLAVTPSSEVLEDIAQNQGPAKSLVAFGYAGWSPGQLEDEISRHAWYMAPADPGIVFDDDRSKVWDHAVARRTQDL